MIYLLGAAVAVLLIYLLRPPAQKILVPSSLLWEQLVEQTANRRRLLRWLLSLLLSALIVLLLVSMIFRLEPRAGSVLDPILLVDNTGSMASLKRPGEAETRLDVAKQRANEILDRSTGTITIADLGGSVGPVQVQNTQEARKLIASIRLAPSATARIPEQLFTSTNVGANSRSVFLISDQQTVLDDLQALATLSSQSEGEDGEGSQSRQSRTIDVIDVWQPAPNVGITQFSANRSMPDTLNALPDSAYLEILNGGAESISARLRVDVFPTRLILDVKQSGAAAIFGSDREPLFERDLSIEAGADWSAALDLKVAHHRFGIEPVAVRAAISLTNDDALAADAQPLDDQAWIVLGAERTRLIAPGGARTLPRWLTRIIATSEQLELVRAQPQAAAAGVTLYPAGTANGPSEALTTPCMVLPPTLSAQSSSATLIDTNSVTLSLPNTTPLQMPWTRVVAAGPLTDLGPTSWMRTAPTPSPPNEQGDTQTMTLLLGPSLESPCLRWLFDPQASQLQTRAEFPALLERILSTAIASHHRQHNSQAWGDTDRELVNGAWREFGSSKQPTAGAALRISAGALTVPARLGAKLTSIGTRSHDAAGSPIPDQPSSVSALNDGKPLLRWPGRAMLAALAIVLLISEAMTRLAGVTE